MNYYELSPEVAGEIGAESIVQSDVHPPIVEKLQHVFYGWLGDELLETFPCYLVSERLMRLIDKAGLTGCHFDHVDISVSDQFEELYPNRELPKFLRLIIDGKAYHDDFGLSEKHRIVVSEDALNVMQTTPIEHCIVRRV